MSDAAQQRIPIHRPPATPVDGVLNIRRDVQLAREAYGQVRPTLRPSIVKAQMALSTMNASVIGDNVEELDNRLIDVVIAAEDVLAKIRTAFPELTVRHRA